MKPPVRPSCKNRLRFSAVALLICQATIGLAQEKSSTTDEPPLGRFLLVASDGLGVAEDFAADGMTGKMGAEPLADRRARLRPDGRHDGRGGVGSVVRRVGGHAVGGGRTMGRTLPGR